jgi:mRNA-degrading endonuclease RelE of RelBE toxin-antitoxin system
MRRVKYSQSFFEEFATLLEQGIDRFGPTVVAAKRKKALDTISGILACYPRRSVDPGLGICAYQVRTTPFVVLYDFDDDELRIHLVIHASADRTSVDLSAIVW